MCKKPTQNDTGTQLQYLRILLFLCAYYENIAVYVNCVYIDYIHNHALYSVISYSTCAVIVVYY